MCLVFASDQTIWVATPTLDPFCPVETAIVCPCLWGCWGRRGEGAVFAAVCWIFSSSLFSASESLRSCCQRRTRNEIASCGRGSVCVCFWSQLVPVSVGSFDGETSSSWDSAFYGVSVTLSGSAVCDSVNGSGSGSGGEVDPSWCPSPSPLIAAVLLSCFFLVRAPSLQPQSLLSPPPQHCHRWRTLLGRLAPARFLRTHLALQAALQISRAAASGAEGVNRRQPGWLCASETAMGFFSFPASQETFASVMVTSSFAFLDSLTELSL